MKKNGIIFALSLALATLFPLYLSPKGEASETKGQCQALFDRLPDSMKRELQKRLGGLARCP